MLKWLTMPLKVLMLISATILAAWAGTMAVRRRQIAADLKKVEAVTRLKIEAETNEKQAAVYTAEAFKAAAVASIHETAANQYEARVQAARARVEEIKRRMKEGV